MNNNYEKEGTSKKVKRQIEKCKVRINIKDYALNENYLMILQK